MDDCSIKRYSSAPRPTSRPVENNASPVGSDLSTLLLIAEKAPSPSERLQKEKKSTQCLLRSSSSLNPSIEQKAGLTKRGCPSKVSTAMPMGLALKTSRKSWMSGVRVRTCDMLRSSAILATILRRSSSTSATKTATVKRDVDWLDPATFTSCHSDDLPTPEFETQWVTH